MTLATETALIVDDDEFFRMALRTVLEGALGFSDVLEAENFGQATALLSEKKIDLAVFDLMMPGMAGPSSLKAVRDRFPTFGSELTQRLPLVEVLTRHRRSFFTAVGLKLSEISYASIGSVFAISYVTGKLAMPRSVILNAIFLAAFVAFMAIPLFGWVIFGCCGAILPLAPRASKPVSTSGANGPRRT